MNNTNPESETTAESPLLDIATPEGLRIQEDRVTAESLSIASLRSRLIKERDYAGYTETLPGFGAREFFFKEGFDRKRHPQLSRNQVYQVAMDLDTFRLELTKIIRDELSKDKLTLALQQTAEHEFSTIYNNKTPPFGSGTQHLKDILASESDDSISIGFRAHSQSNYALIKMAKFASETASIDLRNKLKDGLEKFLGARDALWVSNLPLGYRIANTFLYQKDCKHLSLNFYRASETGVLAGVYCYNPNLGFKIATYLADRILAFCRLEYQRSAVHHLKQSHFILQKNKVVQAEEIFLSTEVLNSGDPKSAATQLKLSEDKIAGLAGMTAAALEAYRKNETTDLLSYDTDYGSDSKANLRAVLADKRTFGAVEISQQEELKEKMDAALDLLNPEDARLIRSRYLINSPPTQKEIANDLGITPQAVSLREANALRKFKAILESLGLDDYSN